MTTNEIVQYQDKLLPAAGGDESRAQMMVQLGQLYGIPESDLVPENIGALATAASWSIELGYLPGADIGMIPFRTKAKGPNGEDRWIQAYTPYVTYDRWKTNAAIGAREEGVFLHHEIEELSPKEVENYVKSQVAIGEDAGEWHPNDKGARCRLILVLPSGREFESEWHYGFWRQNATYSRYHKKWQPDPIPNQRTAQWQANRRAHQSAIKSRYGMKPAQSRVDAALVLDRVSGMARQAEIERQEDKPLPHADAMMAFRQLQREDDGDILFAAENSQPARNAEIEDGEYRHANGDDNPFEEADEPIAKIDTSGWNPDKAKAWAIGIGAFADKEEANAAYAEVKAALKKSNPKSTANDMWDAWIDASLRQVQRA